MRFLFDALIIVFICCIWLLPLELASSWWIQSHGDPLDKASRILKVNKTLGWLQKENFNGEFLKIPLKTNHLGFRTNASMSVNKKIKTVLILGPSSTFGWGVESENTYANQLELMMQQKGISRVINAGVIGFSSFQGKKLAEQLIPIVQPDIVIIAYGVNDLDRHRFYFQSSASDMNELQEEKILNAARFINLIETFSLTHLLFRIADFVKMESTCAYEVSLRKRVSENDFLENLNEIQALSEKYGAKNIILNTPYFLPKFLPANSEIKTNAEDVLKVASEFYNKGLEAFEKNKFKEAENYFTKSIQLNPEQNEVYYMRTSTNIKLKNCTEAKTNFELARATEPKRIASDIDSYNERLLEWTKKNAIPLVDLSKDLSNKSPEQKKIFFVDPIHPSKSGHKIISELIFKTLEAQKL